MPLRSRWVILLAPLGIAPGPAVGDGPPTFPAETRVVALDVVATGGDGRPLDDLRPDEVQVLENGRPCEIRSFRLIRATASRESSVTDAADDVVAAAPSSASPPVGTRSPPTNLIVLFFDRLTLESGPVARRGALDFLAQVDSGDALFAVFSSAGRQFVVPFTNDLAAVRKGVEAATFAGTPSPGATGEASRSPGEPAALQSADLDTIDAIAGVARALEGIQGRRTILYFAEGWQFPLKVRPRYQDAISAATRANVTVHTFDARGLAYRKSVAATPLDGVLGSLSAEHRGGPFGGSMTPRTDARGTPAERLAGPNLEELAQDTGGRAIANTNDLRAGLASISEELRHYYEIVYAPADPANDGRFRRISVKVSRPGVRIRTRKGYFAAARGVPLLPAYELPPIEKTPPHVVPGGLRPPKKEWRRWRIRFSAAFRRFPLASSQPGGDTGPGGSGYSAGL
jgi:VWFA-related protein